MKKLLSVIVVICLSVLACGCGCNKDGEQLKNSSADNQSKVYAQQVYGAARTYTTDKGAESRDLSNTVYKLQNEKQLDILYYGGSVTVGTGSTGEGNSWAAITEQWFRDTYPDAQITVENSAIGGTSTYWGLFRAERDLVSYKPDLVFIEFAINDAYEGLYFAQSAYLMEALIKTINNDLPDTDIVLVLVTDKSKVGQDFEQMAAHKAVAEHYGIPYVNAGAALADQMQKDGTQWSDYAIDYSHPNNDGYRIYADAIIAELENLLPDSAADAKPHKLPDNTYISSGINMDYKVLTADKIEHDEKWEIGTRKTNGYSEILRPLEQGATLEFEFEGESFGVLATVGRLSNVKVTIDGREIKYIADTDTEGKVEALLYDNLADGLHKVKIEYRGTGKFYLCAVFIG